MNYTGTDGQLQGKKSHKILSRAAYKENPPFLSYEKW